MVEEEGGRLREKTPEELTPEDKTTTVTPIQFAGKK